MKCEKKVLALSSGGGHWVQLLRMKPLFKNHKMVFASVHASNEQDVAPQKFYKIQDATRWSKIKCLLSFIQILKLIIKEKPDIVITTGAAPGYFALLCAKWLGKKTIWLDSMANVATLSLSGQKAKSVADLWLTQWPQLATESGPNCIGSTMDVQTVKQF